LRDETWVRIASSVRAGSTYTLDSTGPAIQACTLEAMRTQGLRTLSKIIATTREMKHALCPLSYGPISCFGGTARESNLGTSSLSVM
jgi:hypothetical protein